MNLDIDKAHVQRRLDVDGYDVHMLVGAGTTGMAGYVTSAAFTVTCLPVGSIMPPAPIQMPERAAQVLFQAMWDSGLRPSKNEPATGHIAALENHLKDMRTIAMAYAMPVIASEQRPINKEKGTF